MDRDGNYRGTDKRRSKRSRVLISAKVATTRGEVDVRLRNLSQYGALLDCDRPPPLRSEVTFERGELRVPAHVIWTDGERFGIEFHEPIDEHEVMMHLQSGKPYEPPAHCEPPPMGERADIFSHVLTPEERAAAEAWFHPDGRNLD
jgi:hypothetical protein